MLWDSFGTLAASSVSCLRPDGGRGGYYVITSVGILILVGVGTLSGTSFQFASALAGFDFRTDLMFFVFSQSPFLDLLFKYQCIRTQKKQKVFYWYAQVSARACSTN